MSNEVFSQFQYIRPDVAKIQQQSADLLAAINNAQAVHDIIQLVHTWNAQRLWLGTMQGLAEVHYTQDVSSSKAAAEKEFFDKNNPTFTESQTSISQALVTSKYRAELEAEFGSLFFRRLEDALRTFSPAIKELLVQEAGLQNQYNELTAKAQIEYQGTTYNLSTIAKVAESLDRTVRQEVVSKLYEFLGQNAAKLDTIYDSLVKVRHQKARMLGFGSYIEMRYAEMGRVDYDAADVKTFRDQVIAHVVPIVSELRAAQKKRLGIDVLQIWDEKLQFPDGNPVAQGEHDYIVDAASKMYKELSPETHEFFTMLRERELMDLKSRNNKATGGYCTSFPLYQVPFIFANFNQTSHDVEVLTHEAGHAFQAYRSRNYTVPEYQWPTAEACEIHSMAMEYLTWPWMDSFFGHQTEHFKFYHLTGSIAFLPYGCLVDEFQHWVYEHPQATSKDRLDCWRRLEAVYMPWREHGTIEEFDQGRQWQLQRHIYESPFYYIDYTLASTCAMQFWKWSQDNAPKALERYINVCDIGGSKPFLGIVNAGELQSPFNPNTLQEVVGDCFSWVKRVYPSYF